MSSWDMVSWSAFRIHEMVAVAILIEEVVLAVFHEGTLDLFACSVQKPSRRRRCAHGRTWVTGVPLPGWKFCAVSTT